MPLEKSIISYWSSIEGNWYWTEFSFQDLLLCLGMIICLTLYQNIFERPLTIQSYISIVFNQYDIPIYGWASLIEYLISGILRFLTYVEENNIGWNFWTHKKVEKYPANFLLLSHLNIRH